MQRVIFDPKYVNETVEETFDFATRLGAGETLVGASAYSVVYSGTDPLAFLLVFGAASIAGSVVSQLVTGGVAGVVYSLVCRATTSTGQALELVGRLAVLGETT